MKVCGVEEAGRGPVIGPMVMVGVVLKESRIPELKSIGVKDSKLLTPKKREQLFDRILEIVEKYEVIVMTPKEIDQALESEDLNLNWLEALASAEIINKLKPDKAIMDCPSNNIQSYTHYVVENLRDKATRVIAEHKADLKYPIVGAASIIAKVTRDREIEKLKKKYKVDFGSGYPADPKTKEFLEKNYDKFPFFRKTWASYKRVLKAKSQSHLGDF